MSPHPAKPRLDAADELAQIRDELHVVWCALLGTHAEECIIPIAEHVNGIRMRLAATMLKMEGRGSMVATAVSKPHSAASSVEDLLSQYLASRDAWLASADEDPKNDPRWETLGIAEGAFVSEPCRSHADVRIKAQAVLAHQGLFDTVVNDCDGPDHNMRLFLQSILASGGEA